MTTKAEFNKWVLDTFETWLAQIDDSEVIGLMSAKCQTRAAQIVEAERVADVAPLIESYKGCTDGDVLHLIRPWAGVSELRFCQWQPRKKRLWVWCPRGTVSYLTLTDLKKYQPSRCPAHLRKEKTDG